MPDARPSVGVHCPILIAESDQACIPLVCERSHHPFQIWASFRNLRLSQIEGEWSCIPDCRFQVWYLLRANMMFGNTYTNSDPIIMSTRSLSSRGVCCPFPPAVRNSTPEQVSSDCPFICECAWRDVFATRRILEFWQYRYSKGANTHNYQSRSEGCPRTCSKDIHHRSKQHAWPGRHPIRELLQVLSFSRWP